MNQQFCTKRGAMASHTKIWNGAFMCSRVAVDETRHEEWIGPSMLCWLDGMGCCSAPFALAVWYILNFGIQKMPKRPFVYMCRRRRRHNVLRMWMWMHSLVSGVHVLLDRSSCARACAPILKWTVFIYCSKTSVAASPVSRPYSLCITQSMREMLVPMDTWIYWLWLKSILIVYWKWTWATWLGKKATAQCQW